MSNATRYPLSWPVGVPRTPGHKRQRPKFSTGTFAAERDHLLAELKRAGAAHVVLSTNVELRGDGLPYSGRRNPDDPGVAVYFTRKGKQLSMQCDHWNTVEQNMRALADVIECIRTIERRGTSEMVDAAFSGFAQLPAAPTAPVQRRWSEVLGVASFDSAEEVTASYRRLAKQYHPDRNPGDEEAKAKYAEVDQAYEAFKKERAL
jgi:hypothetical protein